MYKIQRNGTVLSICLNRPILYSFHTTCVLPAKKPMRAPKIVTQERVARKATSQTRVSNSLHRDANAPVGDSMSPGTIVPPESLFKAAYSSGALEFSPTKALAVLQDYQEQLRQQRPGWERDLCSAHDVSPSILSMIARIVAASQSNGSKNIALRMQLSASSLGDASTTLDLIEKALDSSNPPAALVAPHLVAPLQRLSALAQRDQDPAAMVVLARLYAHQGKLDEALRWARLSLHHGHDGSLDAQDQADALLVEAQILQSRNDLNGAEAAFKRAAIDLDDPRAYYALAMLPRNSSSSLSSPEQEHFYLLKAASSGITEACHELGQREFERSQAASSTSSTALAMAMEWFEVAAASGFVPSMLGLARLLHGTVHGEEGRRWLDRVEEVPDHDRAEIRRLRQELSMATVE